MKRPMKQVKEANMGVTIHPSTICPKTAHRTPDKPCRSDMPTTAPTNACELDTGTKGIVGNPKLDNQASSPREAKINSTIE